MNGIINVLKPPGMTSQDVVTYVKRSLKVKKAGHTGTLDPGAAGVLPVCIGKATKVTEYLLNDKKRYRAEMEIGYSSDTLDRYGNIQKVYKPILHDNNILNAFNAFRGEIEQTPPMYSAVKINGRKLYELARAGVTLERETRKAYIYDIDILHINKDNILFDVVCSKGTYIRSLCSDIGKYLGSDAIMTFLIRTGTGPFSIENSITLFEIDNAMQQGNPQGLLLPIESALKSAGKIYTNGILAEKVKHGNSFNLKDAYKYIEGESGDIVFIYDDSCSLLAIGKKDEANTFIKVNKVLLD